ncbi:MAG: type VI secretion system Vgr family protein, partial [Planctomycetota bacterium]
MSANISFSSGALQANDLIVTKLDGYEGLSQLFRYEVQVASQAINIDAQAVLAADATLGIKQGMALSGGGRGYRTVNINGVVCEFEQGEQVSKGWVSYRAVMVPHVWKLTRNVTSRVWIDKTTLQILEDLLAEHGLTGDDFEVRCNDSYPSRHFVMQYEESDFDFIARWLAHEGMFFYFEQSDEGEKLIVGDDTSAYKPVIGAATLAYNPSSQQSAEIDEGGGTSDWTAEEVVTGFNRKQQVSPKKVKLKDYNWMNTADALEVEADINQLQGGRGDSFGYGVQRVTNQNYQVGPEGVRLAKVRAGEHIAREVV